MNEIIQLLVNLQEKDTAISKLNEIIKNLPAKVEQQKENYKDKEDKLNQIRKEKENVEKNLRSKERKLQAVDDELKKFRGKIYEVKSQKEMVSLDSEIKKSEEEKGKLEDEILQLMDANDSLDLKINSLSNELEKELVELKKTEEETNQDLKLNINKLNTAIKEREGIGEKIPKATLTLYEKIRENKNNLAVVPVKDGVCQGCFIKLPPQLVNEVKEGSEIIRCEGCIRILYFKNE